MRVFIQDRDVGQLDTLERGLHLAGHEPVVIYSLTEILDMASHPHLVPDAVLVEAAVIERSMRRLGEATASVLLDILAEPLVIATGPAETVLPMEVGARLPRPVPIEALQDLLSRPERRNMERRTAQRIPCSHSVEVHLYNGGTFGPYAARFQDLSMGGACVRIPPGGTTPKGSRDATVDLWVQDGPLGATRLSGRLAWTSTAPVSNAVCVGVEFFDLTEAAVARIGTTLTR